MKRLIQIINGVYDYYGEHTQIPQSGNYVLKASTADIVYLQAKDHWDLIPVAVDDFDRYFRLKSEDI